MDDERPRLSRLSVGGPLGGARRLGRSRVRRRLSLSEGPLPPAVVLGGGITGISVARGLADAGVAVHALDVREAPARTSRLLASFVILDAGHRQDQMLEWLRSDGPRGAVVLACDDEGLELIARNRAELVQLGYLPMEADDQVLLAMLDKEATQSLAREHGIPVAETRPLLSQADVDEVISQGAFPCVLKPVSSHLFVRRTSYRAKVLTAEDPAELQAIFDEMSRIGVQMSVIEVITGPDDEYVSYYSYLDEQGEPLLHFTKRKIRQYPPRFGTGSYHATTHDPEVAAAGLRFFQSVGLRGLGNVEFKRDGRDGQLKLIECNARFTMSNELIRQAGVDLGLFSYCRLARRPTPPVEDYRDGLYLWDPVKDTRAFLAYRRGGELTFGGWARSLLHPQCLPVARLDDPLPALVRHLEMAQRTANARSSTPRPLRHPPRALVEPLAGSGRRGRSVAARLDLVAATGARYTWRRLRAERHLSSLGGEARDRVYETIWRGAAEAAGAEIAPLAPGMWKLSRGEASTRVYHQVVDLDDPVTLRVALDKTLVHRLLEEAEVPTAEHVEFDVREPGAALEFLERIGDACVVKPAAGTGGGDGTTAGVRRPEDLRRACLHASRGTERLLVERQAPGDVYRLLFLDGELLDVVRSVPPRLIGDGRSTISRLIELESERRLAAGGFAGLSLLGVNLDLVMTLERAGLSLSSVPAAGQVVVVRTVTNNNSAENNETFRGTVSPQVIAVARAAVDAVGLRLAGVDVITTDISRPLAATDGIVAEVNGSPGLHHHYLVADPSRATPVALPILERLLDPVVPAAVAEPARTSVQAGGRRQARR